MIRPRISKHWAEALWWLAFASFGLILPIGIGQLAVAAIDTVSFTSVTDGGQFALYTAVMLTSTLYLIAKPSTDTRLPYTEWFLWLSIPAIFASATFFTLATLKSAGVSVEEDYFRWPSVVLAIASLAMATFAVSRDAKISSIREPDLRKLEQTDQRDLASRLRKRREEQSDE